MYMDFGNVLYTTFLCVPFQVRAMIEAADSDGNGRIDYSGMYYIHYTYNIFLLSGVRAERIIHNVINTYIRAHSVHTLQYICNADKEF